MRYTETPTLLRPSRHELHKNADKKDQTTDMRAIELFVERTCLAQCLSSRKPSYPVVVAEPYNRRCLRHRGGGIAVWTLLDFNANAMSRRSLKFFNASNAWMERPTNSWRPATCSPSPPRKTPRSYYANCKDKNDGFPSNVLVFIVQTVEPLFSSCAITPVPLTDWASDVELGPYAAEESIEIHVRIQRAYSDWKTSQATMTSRE